MRDNHLPLLIVAAAACLAAPALGGEASVTPELLARGLAIWTERGRDVSPLLGPGAMTEEGRAELNLLIGCRADTVEELANGDFGIIWTCPRNHAPVARTAATVRIQDGKITRVLMSTLESHGGQ